MRRLHFVVARDAEDPTRLNWKRFAAGIMVALGVLLMGVSVVYAMIQSNNTVAQESPVSEGLPAPTTLPTNTPIPTDSSFMVSNTVTQTATPIIPDNVANVDITETTAFTPYPEPTMMVAATDIPTPQPPQSTPTNTSQPATATMEPTAQATQQPVTTNPSNPTTPSTATTPTETRQTTVVASADTPQLTATNTPQLTATNTPSHTPTNTPQLTATNTPSHTPTETATSSGTTAETPTNTPETTSKPAPDPLTMFGVEINPGHVGSSIDKANAIEHMWVRYNGILWNEVEATEGTINWSVSSQAKVEEELKRLNEKGIPVVVIIRGTPAWAQRVNSSCGPIKEEKLDAFAAFVQDVVTRYSVEPYNVRYWEIGNEPDVDFSLISDTMPFGCWGDQNDPYYGGGYFAKMLKKVYPAIKQVDPNAKVVLGGLLLDCDSENPPEGKDCSPARFLEGILQNDGGDFFDILAYHGYAFWEREVFDWDVAHSSWTHRGGVTEGKIAFLKDVLQKYTIEKPIISNEIGLLCWDSRPGCIKNGMLLDQQNYMLRTYVRGIKLGLLGTSWYTFNYSGWNEAGLMNRDRSLRPAYATMTFLAPMLYGANYQNTIELLGNAQEGYVLSKGTTTYYTYWSNDETTFDVDLPNGTKAVYRFGTDAAEAQGYEDVAIGDTNTITVGFEPILIEVQ